MLMMRASTAADERNNSHLGGSLSAQQSFLSIYASWKNSFSWISRTKLGDYGDMRKSTLIFRAFACARVCVDEDYIILELPL